jgi:hypothetical protein
LLASQLAPAGGGRIQGGAAKRAAKRTLDAPEHGGIVVDASKALFAQCRSAGPGGSLVPGDPGETGPKFSAGDIHQCAHVIGVMDELLELALVEQLDGKDAGAWE